MLPNNIDVTSTDTSHQIVKRCWNNENLKFILPVIRIMTIHQPGKRYDCFFYIPNKGAKFVNLGQYFAQKNN
jgi:hypothetical protein